MVAKAKEVLLPDIGDFKDVDVIEVLVSPGDRVNREDSLITLESEKATMEVPSPYPGVVEDVTVKVGDKVSQGSKILTLAVAETEETERAGAVAAERPRIAEPAATAPATAESASEVEQKVDAGAAAREEALLEQPPAPLPEAEQRPPPTVPIAPEEVPVKPAHASPAVRRLAREFGVDIAKVAGSGPKGRVTKEDVQTFVKSELQKPKAAAAGVGMQLPALPEVDFSRYGEIEVKPLGRIRQISARNLHRNWLAIPHVTQYDEADITELEAFRKDQATELKGQGIRLSLLAFLLKACAVALRNFSDFNASLHPDGEQLILKKYFHIGVAVDTPNGLVVPVIRNVDQKGVVALAGELGEISAKAREKGLAPADMQGGCFTISSLGGIGGTAFSPIINAPEVAILGVSKAAMKPVYRDGGFEPRLLLPLALSYDHRVIDGAVGARFIVYLSGLLADVRRLLL